MSSCELDVRLLLDTNKIQNQTQLPFTNEIGEIPFYNLNDNQISGQIIISLKGAKRLQHQGLFLSLIGLMEENSSNTRYEFLNREFLIGQKGLLDEDKIYKFSLSNFPRPVETYEGKFCTIRYFVRFEIKRNMACTIIAEKDIGIKLSSPNDPFIRMLAKEIVDNDGTFRFRYRQDKKEYFLNDCIIGRIDIRGESKKPNQISISFNKWECCRIRNDIGDVKEDFECLSFMDLVDYITDDNTDNIIPFKIPLSRFNLQPTIKFIQGNIYFYVGYFIKLHIVEADGTTWSKPLSFNLKRSL